MVRGLIVFTLLFVGTVPIFLLFLLFGLPTLLLPAQARVALRSPQLACARLWILFSTKVLRLSGIPHPRVEGDATLASDGKYLVLCNHRSWTDIMILLRLFGPRMPFPRFLAKRQMLWIPFVGLAIWMLDFPLLRRASEDDPPQRRVRDRQEVARGCRRLGSGAFSLVIYPEGTRMTEEKHRRAQGPYRHLLPPRAGGIGVALEHLGERLDEVVDVTIAYPAERMTYWGYLCGRVPEVRVHLERFPVPDQLLGLEGEVGRQLLQGWLNALWEQKDRRLAAWCGQGRGDSL